MTECIEWTGYTNANGYGWRTVEGQGILAHRQSYKEEHGSIPDGAFILHKCHNKPCVNPDHLYAGTQADNMRDARERGTLPTTIHGTGQMYQAHKCRCEECVDFMRSEWRRYKRKIGS